MLLRPLITVHSPCPDSSMSLGTRIHSSTKPFIDRRSSLSCSFHSMPSFYSWEEVLTSSEDFTFNGTVVMSRDHHPPAGGLSFPNPNALQGQYQMTSHARNKRFQSDIRAVVLEYSNFPSNGYGIADRLVSSRCRSW